MKILKQKITTKINPLVCGLSTMVHGLIFLLTCFTAHAQTLTNNFVITNAPRVSGITNDSLLSTIVNNKTKLQTSIQYSDGLGRIIQTVQEQATTKGYDMVMPQAYDQYSREVYKYLPYAPETGTAGSFRLNAVSSDQNAFYTTPPSGSGVTAITDPYAQTAFDNSPLNRPVEQGAPGVAWQLTGGGTGTGHTVKTTYTINNATSFSSDSINGRQAAMYYSTILSTFGQRLHANGYFPAGTLTVTVSKDENWISGRAGTMEEYKDIDGHVVLKRVYNYTGGAVQMLSTYYIYDDLGRLAYVLPPASGADGAGTISQATLINLCYQYQYDERGRMAQKRIPGKGWEYIIYNTMDQPVATQDSLQRNNNQWIFTKYDAQGRGILTGIWNNGGTAITRANLQTILTGITTNFFEASITTGNGYTNVAWPTSNVTTTLTLNYYDNYTNAPGLPSLYSAPAGTNLATRGELSAATTNVLTTGNMLWSVYYYDYFGRSLESYAQHYLAGNLTVNNYDAISSAYNFTNEPTTVTRKHWTYNSTANPLVIVYNRYTYDQTGRKLNTYEQLTNGGSAADTLRIISDLYYNEIGQLRFKKLHSKDSVNYLQSITYGYNERGWLITADAPLFAMNLYYNAGSPNKAYNGNIMYQYWGLSGNLNNHYTYTYDKLNRLVGAVTSLDNYQESGIAYDTQGNITALNRYQAGTPIDQLTYNYNTGSNQLATVVDANASNSGLVSGTTTYTWDGNGNLQGSANTVNTGQNKSFTYNILNLPNVVTTATKTDTYIYTATGEKLRRLSTLSGVTTPTDYVSGIQYNNNYVNIGFIQTDEGKAMPNGATNYDYNYYLGDNLGNTRVTFGTKTGAAVVYQQDDYYPFGMEILRTSPVPNPKNEYLYNRKELQEDFTEYDYGARFYDPVIARWNTVDPLAEVSRRWSPYNYVVDNPIRFIDPDGMDYQNGIYENGLYGNTVTYLAEDDQGQPPKKKSTKKNQSRAFIFAVAVESVPAVGVEVGLVATLARVVPGLLGTLLLSGDNESASVRHRRISEELVDDLNKGDTKAFLEAVTNWNTQSRNEQDRIVFRYLSQGEYNNIYTTVDGSSFILPFDRNGVFSNKYISPDPYTTSSSAQSKLALPNSPQFGVFTFESSILQTKSPSGPGNYSIAPPKYGQPGGGRQAIISQPFPVIGGFKLY